MTFNPNAQLDPTQVEDRRGEPTGVGGGFGGGGGFGMPIAVGGGGAGLLIMLVIVALNVFGGALTGPSSSSVPADGSAAGYNGRQVAGSSVAETCRTGADANSRTDCLVVGVVNSVQSYWSNELTRRGLTYSSADTVLYSGATQAGCGLAQTAEGPFYCPVDKKVYLDVSFFDELHTKFGAQGGRFADAYVIAHEYGHHVQDLLGLLGNARSNTVGQEGGSVRTELQADCFAGVWSNHAVQTGYLQQLTSSDISQALDAAAAVGDDRIQQETQGRVTPDSFTHGTSQQREHWFTTGYQSGDLTTCDTSKGNL
ncbi:MAG: neutral zinc metallopeptidase [Chloroflexi bacterium]|nr:neutral zinc metallopeptidase [Chloroflexota bacterium]